MTCTCHHCGPRGIKPIAVQVTIPIELTRGDVTAEHELRASVEFTGLETEVDWLDKGHVEDLALTADEEAEAVEQAVMAAWDVLTAREVDDPREVRADYEADRAKEGRVLA